jgi:NAD(P)-dependent dehydrogenase (short-subunit alcohol dehydrogenase family)
MEAEEATSLPLVSSAPPSAPPPTQEELETAMRVIRHLLANVPEARKTKYMPLKILAGQLSKPMRKTTKERRETKKRRKRQLLEEDQEVIEQTGQRRDQKRLRKTFGQYFCLPATDEAAEAQGLAVPATVGATPALLLAASASEGDKPASGEPKVTIEDAEEEEEEVDINGEREDEQSEFLAKELTIERTCYICKTLYKRVHFFYYLMCPECATFNYKKRIQTADLKGRIALLTGARIKIGYKAALVLLRCGAVVIATTRFPKDAAQRFAQEKDFAEWKDRLHVYGLDMRHLPAVERFCEHLTATYPHLDIIINNAAQTVRKPTGFYAHLLPTESRPLDSLPEDIVSTLRASASFERLLSHSSHSSASAVPLPLPSARPGSQLHDSSNSEAGASQSSSSSSSSSSADNSGAVAVNLEHVSHSAAMSQVAVLEEDTVNDPTLFPPGLYDGDQQQIDLRATNSWVMPLEHVSLPEAVEVQAINVLAPFILNSKLKPLLLKSGRDTYIVNVSAMEGQFYRKHKTPHHPHTNMAKAALNMMTRTSAPAYAVDKIYMNSVDTGWINDESPFHMALENEKRGFRAPLDELDAAMRVLDPVLHAVNSGQAVFGAFLKDYRSCPW